MVRDESDKILKTPEFKEIRELREAAMKSDNPALKEQSTRLEKTFTEKLTAINTGPRAQTRLIMENLLLKEKVAELQKLNGDNNRMKRQPGLMGRVKDMPLRPSAGNGSGKIDVPKPRIGSKPEPANGRRCRVGFGTT